MRRGAEIGPSSAKKGPKKIRTYPRRVFFLVFRKSYSSTRVTQCMQHDVSSNDIDTLMACRLLSFFSSLVFFGGVYTDVSYV